MTEYVESYNTFSETRRVFKEYVHTWTINNFKAIDRGVMEITTQEILNGQDLWRLRFFPSDDDINSDFLCVSFNTDLDKKKMFKYSFSICLINKSKKEVQLYVSKCWRKFYTVHIFENRDSLLDEKRGLLLDGNLILRCKVSFYEYIIANPKPISFISLKSNLKLSGFEDIFNNEKFSDVKIIVGDKVFWAYKGILANQSPVFKAMFEHDMKENIENTVEIVDIDHEVVKEMLRFIYVGKINNVENVALDLLAVADKYEIENLKLVCEEALINNLNLETVTSLLVLAEKCKANMLKEKALNFLELHKRNLSE